MATSAINSAASSGSGNTIQSRSKELKAEDFIKMMITQLQNQDPMEPAKNGELLQQMSQIGQLQSSAALQDSLKSMILQNQISSAGNLIGKVVRGMDAKNETVTGVVNSVRVENNAVRLELDNGKMLSLDRVTQIASINDTTAAAA